MEKKIGDRVEKGDILAYIHTNLEEKIEEAEENLKSAFEISNEMPEKYQEILGII